MNSHAEGRRPRSHGSKASADPRSGILFVPIEPIAIWRPMNSINLVASLPRHFNCYQSESQEYDIYWSLGVKSSPLSYHFEVMEHKLTEFFSLYFPEAITFSPRCWWPQSSPPSWPQRCHHQKSKYQVWILFKAIAKTFHKIEVVCYFQVKIQKIRQPRRRRDVERGEETTSYSASSAPHSFIRGQIH